MAVAEPLTAARRQLRASVTKKLMPIIRHVGEPLTVGLIEVGPLMCDLLAGLLGEYDARRTALWELETLTHPTDGPLLWGRRGTELRAFPLGPLPAVAAGLALVLVQAKLPFHEAEYVMCLLPGPPERLDEFRKEWHEIVLDKHA